MNKYTDITQQVKVLRAANRAAARTWFRSKRAAFMELCLVQSSSRLGQSHATHGKVLTASLTPQGARVVASCHSAVDAVESRMLSSMDARERATLQALLKRCAVALEDD